MSDILQNHDQLRIEPKGVDGRSFTFSESQVKSAITDLNVTNGIQSGGLARVAFGETQDNQGNKSEVAIKILRSKSERSKIDAFDREIKIARDLIDQQIDELPQFYESTAVSYDQKVSIVNQESEANSYIMERIRGISLKDIIAQDLDYSIKNKIAIKLFESITTLQNKLKEKGYVYADINTSNIIVDYSNINDIKVRFIDYGAICKIEDYDKVDIAPSIQPPELEESGNVEISKATVYSAGKLIIGLLGTEPQKQLPPKDKLAEFANKLTDLRKSDAFITIKDTSSSSGYQGHQDYILSPDIVDPALYPILVKATAVDPEDRFSDIEEFAKAFKQEQRETKEPAESNVRESIVKLLTNIEDINQVEIDTDKLEFSEITSTLNNMVIQDKDGSKEKNDKLKRFHFRIGPIRIGNDMMIGIPSSDNSSMDIITVKNYNGTPESLTEIIAKACGIDNYIADLNNSDKYIPNQDAYSQRRFEKTQKSMPHTNGLMDHLSWANGFVKDFHNQDPMKEVQLNLLNNIQDKQFTYSQWKLLVDNYSKLIQTRIAA